MKYAALLEAVSVSDGGHVTITINDDDTVTVTRRVAEPSERTVQ